MEMEMRRKRDDDVEEGDVKKKMNGRGKKGRKEIREREEGPTTPELIQDSCRLCGWAPNSSSWTRLSSKMYHYSCPPPPY